MSDETAPVVEPRSYWDGREVPRDANGNIIGLKAPGENSFAPGNPMAFKPGWRGGGRRKGSRDRISASFLKGLTEDFEKHGVDAIEAVRLRHPAEYLKIVASLLPKTSELTVNNKLDDVDDDEIDDMIAALRDRLGAKMLIESSRE